MKKKPADIDAAARAFGERLRELRQERTGLSQDDFARQSGFHRAFIGTVERGETNITLANIVKLCDALNMTLAQFFDRFELRQRGMSDEAE